MDTQDKNNAFKAFVRIFSDQELKDVIRTGRNHFLSSANLSESKDSIKQDIFSIGIFLGEEKERFYPSPGMIEIISKMPSSQDKKIYVNKKAEWLFLCGRNILMESISKNPNELKEGYVLVQNEDDENLGYGIFRQEGKDFIIRNLLDKGKYLRFDESKRNR